VRNVTSTYLLFACTPILLLIITIGHFCIFICKL
jgi:hypothetical protein